MARVVDELGIDHGCRRADIAVINGRMTGYEIKSDLDSLDRLGMQVPAYNRVFDYASVVATDRHLERAAAAVPTWWGVVRVSAGPRGGIRFETVRNGSPNPRTSAMARARLLWRGEALACLRALGVGGKLLRRERSDLYRMIVRLMPPDDLAEYVRSRLKGRAMWRDPSRSSLYGGLSRRTARL